MFSAAKKGTPESRRIWVKKYGAEVVRNQLDVPNCRSLIRLEKTIRLKGKESVTVTRYFISSLDADKVSAKEFQAYILGHWEVENCLHMVKDRDSGEDKHVRGSDWGAS